MTTYNVFGKLSVMLPCTRSPYLRYPKNPIPVYNAATITMPVLSTPFQPPKASGVFILFSKGKTCNTELLLICGINRS